MSITRQGLEISHVHPKRGVKFYEVVLLYSRMPSMRHGADDLGEEKNTPWMLFTVLLERHRAVGC